ncbi:PIN domain-containing protein [Idiomarina abyssalis]|uniref:Uncharacterized protein n=1 Tax=Idiomarina abyssalis TaxID=86102 RepID=A0A8I1GBU3_9GAMM|nr:hypothetical protein [Idiomarina abyssalis]MBJ7265482.1 hypothetical protein [Idiomarina abyssalis]MBJ7316844.1 hypothetical protein [Idiomarina abyssalis]
MADTTQEPKDSDVQQDDGAFKKTLKKTAKGGVTTLKWFATPGYFNTVDITEATGIRQHKGMFRSTKNVMLAIANQSTEDKKNANTIDTTINDELDELQLTGEAREIKAFELYCDAFDIDISELPKKANQLRWGAFIFYLIAAVCVSILVLISPITSLPEWLLAIYLFIASIAFAATGLRKMLFSARAKDKRMHPLFLFLEHPLRLLLG